MEPLFQLDIQNLDIFLPSYKEKLSMDNEEEQMSAVKQIIELLQRGSESERDNILGKLIKFDVISSLSDAIRTSTDSNMPPLLKCFSIVNRYKRFYDNHMAMDVVDSMIKLAYLKIKSNSEQFCYLDAIINSIHNIITKAIEFGINLDDVCIPIQIFHFLKSLHLDDSKSYRLRFTTNALLTSVLEHVNFPTFREEDNEEMILDICQESLNSMRNIAESSNDDTRTSTAVIALCDTCACSTRFCTHCKDESKADERFTMIQKKAVLTETIFDATMDIIIPIAKAIHISEINNPKFQRSLVTCFNELYYLNDSLKYSCSENLSNHLTANGYLMYFSRLTARSTPILQKNICKLLTQILTVLSKQSLPVNTWPGGISAYSNFLFQSFSSLLKRPDWWIDYLEFQENETIAVLVLLYYHYHGTGETDMINSNALTAIVLGFSEIHFTLPLILKVSWFLLAVSYLICSSSNLLPNYNAAVKRLCSALQCSEISDCYTHHIDLMHYCLKSSSIPNDLQFKVMNLWLIESDGDIKLLLTLDCNAVIRQYLFMIVQTGYSESVVKLAVKGIRELMRVEDVKPITEIVWEMLPRILLSYTREKTDRIKAILELASVNEPPSLSPEVVKRCADSIVQIILTSDTDLDLKILAMKQTQILLAVAINCNCFKVYESYIKTQNLLEQLQAHGFSTESPELSAASLKILKCIISHHSNSPVERETALKINIINLTDLLMDWRNSSLPLSCALEFLREFFSQDTRGSPITLQEFENDEETEEIINLYETLHIIYWKCEPIQKDRVCQCLSSVFHFCDKNVESLMYHLCTLMSNYDLIIDGMDVGYKSSDFIEFLTIWLRYRKRYCDDEGRYNSESLIELPFDTVLLRLPDYAERIKENGQSDEYSKLQYVISLFKEDV